MHNVKMQRRKSTTFFFLFLMLTLVSLPLPVAQARRHHKFKGVIIVNQILRLKGTLKINGKEVPEYSGVKQGDVLETGEQSEAVIRIAGLALFRLGPKTTFKLIKFNNRDETRFELVEGQLLSLFRRSGDHEVQLQHSNIFIHGTTFDAQTSAQVSRDLICVCDGKVQVALRALNDGRKPAAEVAPPPAVAPSATPSDHRMQAVLSAAPIPGGSPTPSPSPSATPSVPPPKASAIISDVTILSNNEHKQLEAGDSGITQDKNNLLDFHSSSEIKDLESIYLLP